MADLVSIIITTKNEEKNIGNCIKSIELQTYKNIEIIVVDNGSTDKTREIALAHNARVFNKGPERSAQRNYGMIDQSGGKYVMYADADMVLSPGLIENCLAFINTGPYSALHIPEIVLGRSYWSKVRRFERSFYNGTVIDGVRFFLKEAFVKTGGFDTAMSGPEDWDMDKKIRQNGRIGLLLPGKPGGALKWDMADFINNNGVDPLQYQNVIYHNESEFDLKKYLAKKGYYARSFDGYIRKWGRNNPDIKKQFGFFYRFLGVFLEKGKWIKLLSHPLLTSGMYFLRFMVGTRFFLRKNK